MKGDKMKYFEHIMGGMFYSWICGAIFVAPLILIDNITAQNILSITALVLMVIGFIYGWREDSKFIKDKGVV